MSEPLINDFRRIAMELKRVEEEKAKMVAGKADEPEVKSYAWLSDYDPA
jgi:hypothetical protein